MDAESVFQPVDPWPKPERSDCIFYHSITYPDGETVDAAWDIRGMFEGYIGNYPIAGKTLLDVGTASGFLAFHAEKAGATVTALEARTARELNHIPIRGLPYHDDRRAFIAAQGEHLRRLKNSYWYGWHKFSSKAETIYAPLAELPFLDRKFDVVLAGAILEHLPDPVTVIGDLARLAKEAVIIAYTPVADTDELVMKAALNWLIGTGPENSYTWWTLSRGLYTHVFRNLGFSVKFVDAYAIPTFSGSTATVTRPTIIARRQPRKGQ